MKTKHFFIFFFLFLLSLNFASSITGSTPFNTGDSVCYTPGFVYYDPSTNLPVDPNRILCTSVLIRNNNMYCDSENFVVCDDTCYNGACTNTGVDVAECTTGYESCDGNIRRECVDNSWETIEVCSYSCTEGDVWTTSCNVTAYEFNASYVTGYVAEEILNQTLPHFSSGDAQLSYGHTIYYVGNITSYTTYRLDESSKLGNPYCDDFNLYIYDINGTLRLNESYEGPSLEFDDPSVRYLPITFYFPAVELFGGEKFFVTSPLNSTCLSPFVFHQNGTSIPYMTYYYWENNDSYIYTGQSAFQKSFNISLSNTSIVGDGQSCGYYPDGSPFCATGYSCDYFQCVASDDPYCADVGGNVCGASSCSTGLWHLNTIENWCCNGECENTSLGSVGDWCANNGTCDSGLGCYLYRCENYSNISKGGYSDFCYDNDGCESGLFCTNGRCNYNVTSWVDSPSECSYPNALACNNNDCVNVSSQCGLSGVVGVDCNLNGKMINAITGVETSCNTYTKVSDSLVPFFPQTPSSTFKWLIISFFLFIPVILIFISPLDSFVKIILSCVSVTTALFFFSRVNYIGTGYGVVSLLISIFIVYNLIRGGSNG